MSSDDYVLRPTGPSLFFHHLEAATKDSKILPNCNLRQVRLELKLAIVSSQISALGKIVCSMDESEELRIEAASAIQELLNDASRILEADKKLDEIAEEYQQQGYAVFFHPFPEHLPEFAQDSLVEMMAFGKEDILVSVKASRDEMTPETTKLAETIEQHRDWRYDLHITLGD